MVDQYLQTIQEVMKHIAILNDDYTKMSIDIAVLKNQVSEIIWWFRAIAGAFIVMMISQFWQIILLRKNDKK